MAVGTHLSGGKGLDRVEGGAGLDEGMGTMNPSLTERELEVLEHFARQQTNAEIARDLDLSVGTVKWYAQQIYNKLGVSKRNDAVARAHALALFAEYAPTESDDRQSKPTHHNLPAQYTSFVGRTIELEHIRELLPQARLLTLTGPGGVGKTRLAIQSAYELLHHFPDGVYWIGLFSLGEPDLIVNEIAKVLDLHETGVDSPLQLVQNFLKQRHILLVFDNYEHLLPEGVGLIPTLLTSAPNLHLLITSREALHVIGEQEFAVGPLDVPDVVEVTTAATLEQHYAASLFVQRARQVKPDFMVTDDSALDIAEICRRLDGLPLALELAAARIKLLPPHAMLARLNSRLSTLSMPLLDASGRQQTLRATIDWSFTLLNVEEREIFMRMSVYAGGWSLQAADAICVDLPPESVLNGLGSLTDKSLVRQEVGTDGEPRFTMLHILREYTQELLAKSGKATEVARRHAQYYLGLAEEAAPEIHRGQQEMWLQRLEEDHDNFRQAFEWFLVQNRSGEALQLVAALGWFWVKQDHHSEGFRRVIRALEAGQDAAPELRAKALLFCGARLVHYVKWDQSSQASAIVQEGLAEALQWARAAGDQYCEAWALAYLGFLQEVNAGERDRALSLFHEALDIFRAKYPDQFGPAWICNALGVIYAWGEEFAEGFAYFQEALERFRRLEDWWGVRLALMNLGLIAYLQGEYLQARRHYLELPALRSTMEHRHDAANWLCGVGLVCVADAQPYEGVTILSGVDQLLQENTLVLSYPLDRLYGESVVQLRAGFDAREYADAWEKGQTLSMEHLIIYAQETLSAPL